MKLSVIIVSYNVRHFLEQCLYSVRKASKGLDVEVIVVDNNSLDDSVEMVREFFPEVSIIENDSNVGFSKANNMAIRQAGGEYILLLNPDTVVEEFTFKRTIEFMDAHDDAGALGVKMIDGKGNYLPESKRGLPTPSVAFYKIFGLSRLFPRSHLFGQYHLGYLDKEKVATVDILSGAFMMIRKSVLDQIGLLDESFFMYGEDIDLSYRIVKSGYHNYYFPETSIIHYKGESTRKSSINYVFVFYRAMVIFAKKHFTRQRVKLFAILINLAIWIRASLSIIKRGCTHMALPVGDFVGIVAGLYVLKKIYEQATGIVYPEDLIRIGFSAYALIWLCGLLIFGAYDRHVRISRIFAGIMTGTLAILIGYALLDESYRFSRALILLGALWTTVYAVAIRALLSLTGIGGFSFIQNTPSRFAVVGRPRDIERISNMIRSRLGDNIFIAPVDPDTRSGKPAKNFLCRADQISDLINIFHIDEVIFSADSFPSNLIIRYMSDLQDKDLAFKIAPPESLFIIGSSHVHAASGIGFLPIDGLNKSENRRMKRLFDIAVSLVLLCLWPLLIFLQFKPWRFTINILTVMIGMHSWVGFSDNRWPSNFRYVKPGVLQMAMGEDSPKAKAQSDILYAKDYHMSIDFRLVLANLRFLGTPPRG